MPDVTFRSGVPRVVDYTATANLVSGTVVLLGNTTGIANGIVRCDVLNTAKVAVEVGGGVYHVKVAGNYAAWTKVYWDNAAKAATTTSTNNGIFGYTVETAAAANAVVEVFHHPYA